MRIVIIIVIVLAVAGLVYLETKPAKVSDKSNQRVAEKNEEPEAHLPLEKWHLNIKKVQEKASAENKYIFALFTGSDWCPPCMRLEKTILTKDEFYQGLEKKFEFLFLDFPEHKEISDEQKQHNEMLAEQYQVPGFPTILILQSNGEPIASLRFLGQGVDEFITEVEAKLPSKGQ